MKIRLRKRPDKCAIEIDPATKLCDRRFAPLITVNILSEDTKESVNPFITSCFAGQMSPEDAGKYGVGLSLASFIASQVNTLEEMEIMFQRLQEVELPNDENLFLFAQRILSEDSEISKESIH